MPGTDPIDTPRRYPSFWSWFDAAFEETDQFDKYSVYRRKPADRVDKPAISAAVASC